MLKKRTAFTLVEVLIALAISSFIVFGMIQLYRNLVGFLDYSRDKMILNRKSCLLIDQIQKDISSSFVSKFQEEVAKKQPGKPAEEVAVQKKDKKKDQKYFVGEVYDGEYRRINGKKWELFKSINFICTNPLQVYGERKPRLVRIKYELLKDKQRSSRDKTSYNFIRKETYDLDNYDFKDSEELKANEKKDTKKHIIRIFTIAEDIKELYFEYVSVKPQEEEKKTSRSKHEEEEIRSFVWDLDFIKKNFLKKKDEKKDDEQTDYIVPQKIDFMIVFWDEQLVRESSFSGAIPIFSYPSLKEEAQAPKAEQSKEPGSKTGDTALPKPPQATPPDLPGKPVPGKPVPGKPVPGKPVSLKSVRR